MAFEVAAEVVEALGPELVVVSDPVGDGTERLGLDAVEAAAAGFSVADEAGSGLNVLGVSAPEQM